MLFMLTKLAIATILLGSITITTGKEVTEDFVCESADSCTNCVGESEKYLFHKYTKINDDDGCGEIECEKNKEFPKYCDNLCLTSTSGSKCSIKYRTMLKSYIEKKEERKRQEKEQCDSINNLIRDHGDTLDAEGIQHLCEQCPKAPACIEALKKEL